MRSWQSKKRLLYWWLHFTDISTNKTASIIEIHILCWRIIHTYMFRMAYREKEMFDLWFQMKTLQAIFLVICKHNRADDSSSNRRYNSWLTAIRWWSTPLCLAKQKVTWSTLSRWIAGRGVIECHRDHQIWRRWITFHFNSSVNPQILHEKLSVKIESFHTENCRNSFKKRISIFWYFRIRNIENVCYVSIHTHSKRK